MKTIGLIVALSTGVPISGPWNSPPPSYKLIEPEIRYELPFFKYVALGLSVPIFLGNNYLAAQTNGVRTAFVPFLHVQAPILGGDYASIYARAGLANVMAYDMVGLNGGLNIMTEIGGLATVWKEKGLAIKFGWLHYSDGTDRPNNTGHNYLKVGLEWKF